MYKKSVLALFLCMIVTPTHAMQLQRVLALQGSEKVATLTDCAAHRLVEELLKMSLHDMTCSLDKIPLICQEILKKVLDTYYPCEPKVQLKQILAAHTNRIISVHFSPDSKRALTESWDGTARVWDLCKTPIVSQQLTGHSQKITSLIFSPDGRFALTGSDDRYCSSVGSYTIPYNRPRAKRPYQSNKVNCFQPRWALCLNRL